MFDRFVRSGECGQVYRMLEDCRNVWSIPRRQGGPGFSKRERAFLDEIGDRFARQGWLDERRAERLRKIWERI